MATAVTPSVTSGGWAWLKAHERIVMLAMVLIFGGYGVEKYFDVEAAKSSVQLIAAQQQVTTDKANSAALAAQAAQATAQLQAEVQADHTLIASLAASVAARNTGLVQQVKVDSTLPLAGVAARWNTLLPTVTPTVTPVGLGLTPQEAHDSLASLEQVPVLTQNLKDETTLADTYQKELAAGAIVLTDDTNQISAMTKQLTDQTNECKVQVAQVKAEARKSKVKWFKIGFVSGFLGGLWAGHVGL